MMPLRSNHQDCNKKIKNKSIDDYASLARRAETASGAPREGLGPSCLSLLGQHRGNVEMYDAIGTHVAPTKLLTMSCSTGTLAFDQIHQTGAYELMPERSSLVVRCQDATMWPNDHSRVVSAFLHDPHGFCFGFVCSIHTSRRHTSFAE
jgi:hypothetical protein